MSVIANPFRSLDISQSKASVDDLQRLKSRLEDNLADLARLRYQINENDYNYLLNQHRSAVSKLETLSNLKQLEQANSYNQSLYAGQSRSHNPYAEADDLMMVVDRDGKSKLIPRSQYQPTTCGWIKQYQQSKMAGNPISQTIPAVNVWASVPKPMGHGRS